jgi:hypothetical protein
MSPLCGEFLGPGIEAMVARAIPATCGGYAGWAAFRHEADGSWHLVWKERDGQWNLTAVGNDLEETDNILGPHDARCVGEKATKTRIWHWDGQEFVAGPWTVHLRESSGMFLARWRRSGILCFIIDRAGFKPPRGSVYHNGVACASGSRRGSQQADLYPTGRVKTCRAHTPTARCGGSYCGCEEGIPQVTTGEQVVEGRYTCRILKNAVECVNTIGQGFVINPRKIRRLP